MKATIANDRRSATSWAQRPRVIAAALSTPLLVLGLAAAVRDAWVCDDAFISFRYADHLGRGLGLVYNPGERVEGYTHFLWVVLLAALHQAHFDLVALGRYLPIAACSVALHRDMQIWASGGLETAAFTFCVTAAVLAASSRDLRVGLVATLAALATLFRPEGILLSVAIAAGLVWRRLGKNAIVRFAVVWVLLVAPLSVRLRAVWAHGPGVRAPSGRRAGPPRSRAWRAAARHDRSPGAFLHPRCGVGPHGRNRRSGARQPPR